jgi:hypothetical protein
MIRTLGTALALALLAVAPAFPQEAPPKAAPAEPRTLALQKQVTELRGLKFTREVKVGTYTREELVAFITREQEREFPREKAERIRKSLSHFGLMPPDLDLYQTVIDLLAISIDGFYHPDTKELRLIKPGAGVPDDDAEVEHYGVKVNLHEITLVHELCHAAQDQNFDLTTVPIEIETNDDLVQAVRSLVEGEATIVGLKFGFKEQFDAISRLISQNYKDGRIEGEDAAKIPVYLQRSLTFPYGFGSDFVLDVLNRAGGDWNAVSKMYEDLPSSTEQILHPKKYAAATRDFPQDVSIVGLAELAGSGWKQIDHNVHGEFGTLLVLDEFKTPAARARRRAAAGWDGDRYFVFENAKGGLAGVWYTVWDSEEDAAEFFDAYALVLQAKHEGAKKESAAQKVTFEREASRAVLERRGQDVLVLDGFDAEVAGRVNKFWSAAKKTEVRKVDRVPPKKAK